MTKERLEEIRKRINAAMDDDHWNAENQEGRDILMMLDMVTYIGALNIEPETYKLYFDDMFKNPTDNINFTDWVYEHGYANVDIGAY